MNIKKLKKRAQACGLGLIIGLCSTTAAYAVHDEKFELEGNITKDGALTVDWENLFDVAGTAVPTPKAALPAGFGPATFVRDFVPGKKGPDQSTFTTGSKDTLDILGGWECTSSNNLGAKFDVINIYATAYLNPSNEVMLYFALERSGNEGDGNVGFWFLQDGTVGCTLSGKSGSFTGNHVDGDLLIVSEFSNGGSVSTIEVYKWQSGGLVPAVSGVDCTAAGPGDGACATVNDTLLNGFGAGTDIPWLTETKQPGNTPSNDLDVSKFFEGGVNLSANNLEACFSTYMGVTRSSTSLTATLHDYAIGSFPFCAIKTRKTCDTVKLINDDPLTYKIEFEAFVTNDGLAPISKDETLTIVDDAGTPTDTSDDVTIVKTVGSLTGGSDWAPDVELHVTNTSGGFPTGEFNSTTNGPLNGVKAEVTIGGGSPISATNTFKCPSLELSPALAADKECTDSSLALLSTSVGNVLAVKDSFTIEVCNTGTAPLVNVDVDDDTAGFHPALFDLDFAKLCTDDSDCIGTCSDNTFKQCTADAGVTFGDSCMQNSDCTGLGEVCLVNNALTVKQCLDDEDKLSGEFGKPVCFAGSGSYYPTQVTGINGTSMNEVVVSADTPISPLPVQASDSDSCDLCPTPYTPPTP